MIQDISPKQMFVDYRDEDIQSQDRIIVIDESEVVVFSEQEEALFPTFGEVKSLQEIQAQEMQYLFAVDSQRYFLYTGSQVNLLSKGHERMSRRDLFENFSNAIGFIAYTAGHVYDWYKTNKYCGSCGQLMSQRSHERGLNCEACGLIKYPQISPVVIVAIQNQDKLLLTKYANSTYNRYALVAGFVEIGETLESAVKREVMEEVGLQVQNIRYFDSQPWGITGGLLTGFFAEVQGDDQITLDTEELKEGVWMSREEMPALYENEKSLTRTMMHAWFNNEH